MGVELVVSKVMVYHFDYKEGEKDVNECSSEAPPDIFPINRFWFRLWLSTICHTSIIVHILLIIIIVCVSLSIIYNCES